MTINIPNITTPDLNFTYIQHHFIEWSTQGYVIVFGFFFLPIFYMGIIGFVYTRMKSVTAAVVAILIIFSTMGNAFMKVPLLASFLQITVALIMSVLVVFFISRIRS
jgi:hypothetical protein